MLSPNPILTIALVILQWQRFYIVFRNRQEEKFLLSWERHEDFRILKEFYQANITIVNTDELFFLLCNLNKTQKHSTTDLPCIKSNILCFFDPYDISNLTEKRPGLRLHSWLIITLLNSSQWEDGLGSLSLDFNSEMYLASGLGIPTNDQYFYKVYEIYKIAHDYPLKFVELCDVGMNGSLIGSKCLEQKYQRRKNLENVTFKVVGLDQAEYYLNVSADLAAGDGKYRIHGGLLAEIFQIIYKEINASYALQVLNGYKYGSFVNGSWNGMIGMLSRSEVDMSCSEISMVSDRLLVIGFTNSFMIVGRRIYIRKTLEERQINWKFFANPFSPVLLITVALAFLGFIIVLWLINVREKCTLEDQDNINELAWVVLCALCQKGATWIPSNRSQKIIFAVIYVTFLIIYTCYSATLTSQLTFSPPVQLPFNDLNGLVNVKGWSGGPVKGDLTQVYMEKTCPEILNISLPGANVACELLVKVWNKVVSPKAKDLPTNFREGLVKVLNDRFAFVAATYGARNEINTGLSSKNVCNVQELDGDHVSSNIAFGLRKNFPYRGLINYKLLQLQEAGILSRLKNFWLPKLNKDCDINVENFVQISISDFAFAPILVFFSILCSCVIFIIERLNHPRTYLIHTSSGHFQNY